VFRNEIDFLSVHTRYLTETIKLTNLMKKCRYKAPVCLISLLSAEAAPKAWGYHNSGISLSFDIFYTRSNFWLKTNAIHSKLKLIIEYLKLFNDSLIKNSILGIIPCNICKRYCEHRVEYVAS